MALIQPRFGAFIRRCTAGMMLILMLLSVPGCAKHQAVSPLIALFTDFGSRDGYSSQLKGAVYSVYPSATVVDLTHEASDYDIKEASYLLEKSCRYLPPGSIVVAVVDPTVGGNRLPVAIKTQQGRIYVGPDNGIFSHVIAAEGIEEARVLENKDLFLSPDVSSTFHGRDIFGPVAAHLAAGTRFDEIGPKAPRIITLPLKKPVILGDKITGEVVFIDHYGNVITNITRDILQKAAPDSLLKITIKGKTTGMPLMQTYSSAPDQRPFVIFNSQGELEIARLQGSAAAALQARPGDPVVVRQ